MIVFPGCGAVGFGFLGLLRLVVVLVLGNGFVFWGALWGSVAVVLGALVLSWLLQVGCCL